MTRLFQISDTGRLVLNAAAALKEVVAITKSVFAVRPVSFVEASSA